MIGALPPLPAAGWWVAGLVWALVHLHLVVPRLPEPTEPDGKPPYASLVDSRADLQVGLLAAFGLTPLFIVDARLAPLWWVLGSAVATLVWIDWRTTWLPRALTIICAAELLAALALALILGLPVVAVGRALAGAFAAGLFWWLVWRLTRGGLGFGDVRLAPLLGLVAAASSWQAWWTSILAGAIIGGLWGIVVALRSRGTHTGTAFAYGPSLFLGVYAGLAWSLVS